MDGGTRNAQLVEAVATLCGETTSLKDKHDRESTLMENVPWLINNLAASYDNLAQLFSNVHSGQGLPSGDNLKLNANTLFEGQG